MEIGMIIGAIGVLTIVAVYYAIVWRSSKERQEQQ